MVPGVLLGGRCVPCRRRGCVAHRPFQPDRHKKYGIPHLGTPYFGASTTQGQRANNCATLRYLCLVLAHVFM
jgi:hypothetical protein